MSFSRQNEMHGWETNFADEDTLRTIGFNYRHTSVLHELMRSGGGFPWT